jgi:nucleoside-diphosphate-sugar epimerase
MSDDKAFWEEKNCLVTGGMGFGGSHLCEQLLKRGATVYVLDRIRSGSSYLVLTGLIDDIEFIQGDIRDLELLKFVLNRFEIDTVFHLAAQPIVPMSNIMPYETLSVNVLGTYAVLEAVRTAALDTSLVFASSGAYYGTTKQQEPIIEEQAANKAANIYAPSKIAADFAVRSYVQTYGLNAAVCRFINTYGPGSTNFSTIVPRAILNLIECRPYDFGSRDDGTSTFDYLHVRDMARGYIAVAENLEQVRGEAFNFSGGAPISVRDLVRYISRLFDGREREPVFTGIQHDIPIRKCLSCSKAERLLSWRPAISLSDGLEETIDWYKRFWPRLMKRYSYENVRSAQSSTKN